MNKDLEKIQARSAAIMKDYPDQRAAILDRMNAAKTEKAAAAAALEDAANFQSYDRAEEALKRADLAIRFAEKELEQLETAARMPEAEYEKAVAACKAIMDKAVNEYRKKALALMDQLKALQDEYRQTAADTNSTLVKLDEAANVLQRRYMYETKHFQGAPDQTVRNPRYWQIHALRYDNGNDQRLATACSPEDKAAAPHVQWNSVLSAAWNAVGHGYPNRSF